MYLKTKLNGDLVEVLGQGDLIDPCCASITGRYHRGEEAQDPESFDKKELIFPSGEELPVCWVDADYRKAAV